MTRLRVGSIANPASIDHAGLGSLNSDDHAQYLTTARGQALIDATVADYAPIYAGVLETAEVTVTTGQLLALNATPKTLVAAPGSGKALLLVSAEFWLDYATTAYGGIAGGEDLTIKYTDASGAVLATVETTGFLDATADAFRWVLPTSTAAFTPVANAPLVLHLLTGEIATGDSPLKVRVTYRTIDLGW